MDPILLWCITIVLFAIGTIGTIVPGLPGLGFVFAGVLLYSWATDWAQISTTTVVVVGFIALLASLADWFGSGLATQIGGGKRKAFVGTLLGGVLGLLVASLPGMLIGAFVGAMAGAILEGKKPQQAGKIAVLSIMGILGAKVLQLGIALGIIITFIIALFV